MADTTTAVEFTTRIDKATDGNNSRYTLAGVELIPLDDDHVYATACDSRQLVAVKCEGKTDGRTVVPPSVLPNRKPSRRNRFRVIRNGRWETTDGRFETEEVEGRSPRYEQVLPEAARCDHLSLPIDVRLLVKQAEALGTHELTLLINVEQFSERKVTQAVCIVPQDATMDGFGIVMPQERVKGDHHALYGERRAEYVRAQENCPR